MFQAGFGALDADIVAFQETILTDDTDQAASMLGPDPAGFWQAISPMLRQAAKAGRPVRVFGEMVTLLWDGGLIDAALEVEAMRNELGAQYPFSLLCAYPAQPAACAHQTDALSEVYSAHTQVTGAPPEAA